MPRNIRHRLQAGLATVFLILALSAPALRQSDPTWRVATDRPSVHVQLAAGGGSGEWPGPG